MDELILGDSPELLIDKRGKNPPFSPLGVPVVSGMSVREGRLDRSSPWFGDEWAVSWGFVLCA